MHALCRASIWHPDAIPPDEWKYRNLKRVWLPLFDLIVFGAGLWALIYGSPLLHRLFREEVIDVVGGLLAAVALICLFGVVFPRLWKIEIAGKITMLALLSAYAAAIIFYRANPDPSAGFVVFVIFTGFPLPLFRLTLLGEEIKERADERDKT